MRHRAEGLTVALLLAAAGLAAAMPPPSLRLADDEGKPLERRAEACFSIELRTECVEIEPGAEVPQPPSYFSLRIEGTDHGPLQLTRQEVEKGLTAAGRLVVPRKALLRIEGIGQQPLTLSLYRPEDPSFRNPAFRTRLNPGEAEAKVPSGAFVASLAVPGYAPDLHRLAMRPATRHRISHRPRQGWSMIARIRAASTLKPVPDAEAHLFETVGYGQPDRPLDKLVSGADGLVLLSGLRPTMVSLEARHPGFLPARAGGLTASPGTFAFREVDLGLGGRIVAQVTAHGRPLTEGICEIHGVGAESPDPADHLEQLWQGKVNTQGSCTSSRLPRGEYRLRVRIGKEAQVHRWVAVEEGADTQVDLPLSPTRVFGEVRRSDKPVAGYFVEAARIDRESPRGVRGDADTTAESDEDGRYELTLWMPGWYTLRVRSGARTPSAEHQEITTEGNEEKRVDFDLSDAPLRGTVVDEAGRPVAEANVLLRWSGMLLAKTDAQGRFEVDLEDEGTGKVFASKRGYRQSEEVDVTVAAGGSPAPVTLLLKRKESVTGRVVSAGGGASPGAWITATQFIAQDGPLPFATARAEADGRFEVETPPGASRLFASGPACPLFWVDLPAHQPAAGEPRPSLDLQCPALPAALELTLVDETGKPRPHMGVVLRSAGVIVPQPVLSRHLQWLGLAATSDGAGHLVLAGLAPGDYELFLSALASESTLAGGSQQGYLTTVSLPPLQTTSLEVTIPGSR